MLHLFSCCVVLHASDQLEPKLALFCWRARKRSNVGGTVPLVPPVTTASPLSPAGRFRLAFSSFALILPLSSSVPGREVERGEEREWRRGVERGDEREGREGLREGRRGREEGVERGEEREGREGLREGRRGKGREGLREMILLWRLIIASYMNEHFFSFLREMLGKKE